MTRVDLHLHSRASTHAGSGFLQRSLLPESCTDPEAAHRTAEARGMDLGTLTDHDTISGAPEIAHHPDVLVGMEITTTFAEDRVPLHVPAWGVDEATWADLDRLRPTLHELVTYLEAADVPHALAHPLQRPGADLPEDHVERCLLLFPLGAKRRAARGEHHGRRRDRALREPRVPGQARRGPRPAAALRGPAGADRRQRRPRPRRPRGDVEGRAAGAGQRRAPRQLPRAPRRRAGEAT